ncbi:MAG: tetratricopeptide repeat protein, partial [Candidatus Azobacteroides sp.]|nr:tetratricopeptide repeat protein [Candidatus Azobacteroides sp.]
MKRLIIIFPLLFLAIGLFAQTPKEIITQADSLTKNEQYEQAISLLQRNKDIMINTDSTDFETAYNMYVGNAYLQTKAYDKAEVYMTKCFSLIEKKYGKYSENYCNYYHLLISVYDLSYNYDKLVDSYLNYLDIIEKVYGKDIPEYAQSLTVLGNLYTQLSKYDLAEKYFTQALELQEKNLGKDNSDYINTYNNLGILYFNLADYEKARTVFENIKNILENKKDADNLTYAGILMQLGLIDLYTGNLESSEKLMLNAKQTLENGSNTSSLIYITILRVLGELYITKSNYPESETYLSNAKNLYVQLGGNKQNTNFAFIIADLATVYNSTGDYEKAEQYFLEALKILKEATGVESAFYATIISNLGTMYFYTGNYPKAEETFIETKNIQEQVIGTNHPDYARTLGNLGTVYMEIENFQLAEKYLLKSKEIYGSTNNKAPQISMLLNSIGMLYYKMGNTELAADYFFKSQNVMLDLSGKDSPDYGLTLLNLSGIFNQWGKDTVAVNLAKTAATIFYENFGGEHPNYILALNTIGLIRIDQGIYDKAEMALLTSDSLYVKVFGKNYPDRIFPLNNLSYLYAMQGKYDLALKYILEANELSSSGSPQLTTLGNLCFIYRLLEKYDFSFQYLQEWYKQLTQTIISNFSFMSTNQRKDFWDKSDGYALEQATKNLLSSYPADKMKSFTYDNTLFSKGLLLRSSNEVRDAILNSGNQKLITKFEDLQALRQQIIALQSKTDSVLVAYTHTLEAKADSLDKDITIASSDYRNLKSDLTSSWQDVQKQLKPNEVAIEFVNYTKFTNTQMTDSVMYCALLLRNNSKAPEYVPLFEQSQLSELLNNENPDITKRIQKLYNGENPRLFNGQKLYNLIWQPLEKYLDGVETIYYSPAGLLNRISFSAIPVDTLCLTDKYNLHLVSSTREIVNKDKKQTTLLPLKQVVEYGGIRYDVQDTTQLISYAEKYKKPETEMFASRSLPDDSTRSSGWNYLSGTEIEVNDIQKLLQQSKVSNIKYMG